ncbi:MAG: hypothetical protein COV75_02375 [Candidatus Omnitrophica bacterium CG11_big_fil_rev_8_21_14_0_20_63_9]|nr:MAG: hypothetical protein COV75_02375 [Candidatus Omnitrophica bacterium CG11_big_fil_rev_8_21_14_0_20_63_9]
MTHRRQLRTIQGTVALRDLRSISEEEYRAAVGVFQAIQSLIERRPSEIARRGGAVVGYPDKNWKPEGNPSDFFRFTAHVLQDTPSYEVINRLRFFTGGFSGVPLLGREWTYENYLSTYRHYSTERYDALLRQRVFDAMRFSLNDFRAAIRDLPEEFIVKPPRLLGEIGWQVGETVVNFDTYSYQERAVLLYESGVLNWLRERERANGTLTFLEIGGGYGALALYLKRLFPSARYLIVDLPESLFFSATYLGLVDPQAEQTIYTGADSHTLRTNAPGYTFIPNYVFEDVVTAGMPVDLALNTLSFHEMSSAQVRQYAKGIKALLGREGVLYEQNGAPPPGDAFGCDPEPILAEELFCERFTPRLITPQRGVPRLWSSIPRDEMIERRFKPLSGRTFAAEAIMARRWVEQQVNQWKRSRWLLPLRQLKRVSRPWAGR